MSEQTIDVIFEFVYGKLAGVERNDHEIIAFNEHFKMTIPAEDTAESYADHYKRFVKPGFVVANEYDDGITVMRLPKLIGAESVPMHLLARHAGRVVSGRGVFAGHYLTVSTADIDEKLDGCSAWLMRGDIIPRPATYTVFTEIQSNSLKVDFPEDIAAEARSVVRNVLEQIIQKGSDDIDGFFKVLSLLAGDRRSRILIEECPYDQIPNVCIALSYCFPKVVQPAVGCSTSRGSISFLTLQIPKTKFLDNIRINFSREAAENSPVPRYNWISQRMTGEVNEPRYVSLLREVFRKAGGAAHLGYAVQALLDVVNSPEKYLDLLPMQQEEPLEEAELPITGQEHAESDSYDEPVSYEDAIWITHTSNEAEGTERPTNAHSRTQMNRRLLSHGELPDRIIGPSKSHHSTDISSRPDRDNSINEDDIDSSHEYDISFENQQVLPVNSHVPQKVRETEYNIARIDTIVPHELPKQFTNYFAHTVRNEQMHLPIKPLLELYNWDIVHFAEDLFIYWKENRRNLPSVHLLTIQMLHEIVFGLLTDNEFTEEQAKRHDEALEDLWIHHRIRSKYERDHKYPLPRLSKLTDEMISLLEASKQFPHTQRALTDDLKLWRYYQEEANPNTMGNWNH